MPERLTTRPWWPWARRVASVALLPLVLEGASHVYGNQLFLLNLVVYLVLAQGVNISYGFTGYLPFGYVGFFGAGAYGAALAVMFLHTPGVLDVVFGGLAAIVVGAVLSPLLRLSGAYFALASLAAAEALYQVVANPSLASVTKGPYGVDLSAIFDNGLAYRTGLVVLAIALGVVVWLRESRFGLSLRAIRDDPLSAAMGGVSVVRARNVAWLLSAGLAGLAGAVFAWVTSVFYPTTVFDLNVSVFAIVFALFGGTGTLLGPVAGTVVLYSLYQFIGVSSPQDFQLVYGLLIVLLVLFLPGGLGAVVRQARERIAPRRERPAAASGAASAAVAAEREPADAR